MQNNILLTPVDELVELVEANPNCTVKFLSDKLELPEEILQRWLVILDEFEVLDISYKGFDGFVKMSDSSKNKKEEIDVENIKNVFVSKCREKGMGFKEMEDTWPQFLEQFEEEIKKLFEVKAKKRGFDQTKIKKGWEKFRRELNNL